MDYKWTQHRMMAPDDQHPYEDDPPDPVDAMETLAVKLDELSDMLEARYPDDDVRRVFTLVLVLDFGMERVREQWAREHQKRHGCEL